MMSNEKFLSNIPTEWLNTYGEGCNIGVCETGCEIIHPDIANTVKGYKEFGEVSYAHGNHVIGIICGGTKKPYVFNGFCNKANVYVGAAVLNKDEKKNKLFDILTWLADFDLDVLNLSLAYETEDDRIYGLLMKLSEKTIINCAFSPRYRYPNSYSFVNSVGYSEMDGVDILGPRRLTSIGMQKRYVELGGSSISTAFVSGVAGLARAYDKNITREQFLKIVLGDKLFEFKCEKSKIYKSNRQQIILEL